MPDPSPSQPALLYLRLPNWLGDVCMCLPILESLLQKKEYELVVVARPWAQQLLKHYPIPHWVLVSGSTRQSSKAVQAHRKVHRQRAARGLIIPDSFSSAWVFWRAGIPSAGVRDEGRSLFLRWPFDKPALSLHTVAYWYQLAFEALQRWQTPIAPLTGQQLKLRLPADDAPLLRQLQLHEPRRTILIAPTATGRHHGQVKIWPYFEELTQLLQAEQVRVIMCPPDNEISQAEQNAPSAERLPPLPIDQFAQLCRSVGLVVCNDSGVSHVAAAAQARQITLFGVTASQRTGPWSVSATCLGELGRWPSLAEVHEHCLRALEKRNECV